MTTYEWLRYLSTLDGEHTALAHFKSITLAPKQIYCSPVTEKISLVEERSMELIDSNNDAIILDNNDITIVETDPAIMIAQEGNLNGLC